MVAREGRAEEAVPAVVVGRPVAVLARQQLGVAVEAVGPAVGVLPVQPASRHVPSKTAAEVARGGDMRPFRVRVDILAQGVAGDKCPAGAGSTVSP